MIVCNYRLAPKIKTDIFIISVPVILYLLNRLFFTGIAKMRERNGIFGINEVSMMQLHAKCCGISIYSRDSNSDVYYVY